MPAFVVYNLESLYLKELSDKASICSFLLEAVSCHATAAWNLLLYPLLYANIQLSIPVGEIFL